MRKRVMWLLVPALLLGACSDGGGTTSDEDAADVLAAAFEATGEEEATTLTLSLASTTESLTAAGELTEEQADLILGSQLVISGVKADDPADASARVALEVPDTDGFELLVDGTDLYLRADVEGLASAVGEDTSQIDAFVQRSGADFLQAAVDGEFLKFEGADQLAGQLGTDPGQISEQQQQLLEQFGNALKQDAEVSSEGEDDVGEHFTVSVPLRKLYQRFLEFASQAGAPLPPGSLPPESEIPEGDLTADVWVADDKVAQFELDFLQFAKFEEGEEVPEGVDEMGLRIALSYEAEEVSPP
ncbi:MAG: hypothetical protein M3285_05360, partial [Actinomycetota bacterium]|nr:hypothetical protein [Actinomycetota bacterium]